MAIDAGLDAALATLDSHGVSGASECRRSAKDLKDAARVLVTVNPHRKNKDFDALLRAAHQTGLRRRGDAELLLRALSEDQDLKTVASNAKRLHRGTLRGALTHDVLSNPRHWYLAASVIAFVVLLILLIAGKYASTFDGTANLSPELAMVITTLQMLYPMAWIAIKVDVLLMFLAAGYSGYVLLGAASKLGEKRASAALPYAKLATAVALVVVGTLLSRSAPYMFVLGCCAAVFVLRRA